MSSVPGNGTKGLRVGQMDAVNYNKQAFSCPAFSEAELSTDIDDEGPIDIAVVGDLTDRESDITEKLLETPAGGECTLYFDSPGGSAYAAISLMSVIQLRSLRAVGVVTGECSSAALWPFAACWRRLVTPYSVLLFHPMKWQSEEHVGLAEASEWARHFERLEKQMDQVLAQLLGVSDQQLAEWMQPGRYVSGTEFADAGLAELVELGPLPDLMNA